MDSIWARRRRTRRPATPSTTLTSLPNEVQRSISGFLPLRNRASLAGASSQLHSIVSLSQDVRDLREVVEKALVEAMRRKDLRFDDDFTVTAGDFQATVGGYYCKSRGRKIEIYNGRRHYRHRHYEFEFVYSNGRYYAFIFDASHGVNNNTLDIPHQISIVLRSMPIVEERP
jgi:hypothetical protein